MLSVCLVFLYVLLAAYVIGLPVLTLIARFCAGRKANTPKYCAGKFGADSCLMAGLVTLTVYAQIFSLFYKVGFAAHLLLMVICAVIAVVYSAPLKDKVTETLKRMTKGKAVYFAVLFLVFAYGTSRGIIHYDTGLYHAQSIRWIEEFGLVKGLGNLHCRLAYNSSSFGLSALFSFAFLGGQSYHCMAGFFAMILAKVCGELALAWKTRKLLVSDYARIMAIYYLLMIFDEMVSPASDYFTVITVFYIVIKWLALIEKKEESFVPYALLCLLGVFTMSLKLSAALILLLTLKPAYMLIKEKNYRAIIFFLLLGTAIIAPYLIRNVMISGWLIYPFTFPDIFSADWKIPKGIAAYDAKEIQVWGRGVYDVAKYGDGFSVWFPPWFGSREAMDQLFIAGGIAASATLIAAVPVILLKRRSEAYDWLLAAATVDLSFLFWLMTAPLIRYGYVYVFLAPAVTFSGLMLMLIRNRVFYRVIYAGLCFLGCYKTIAFARETAPDFQLPYFVNQQDYENFPVLPYEIEGITFYYPEDGDRTGYEAFPSSPAKADITLRGSFGDGFQYKK